MKLFVILSFVLMYIILCVNLLFYVFGDEYVNRAKNGTLVGVLTIIITLPIVILGLVISGISLLISNIYKKNKK